MIKSLIILLIVGLSLGEICPDHYPCPGSTCCLLLSGVYGCCPYKNAVCCPDKIHCCSEHETCNVKAQKCDSHLETLPFVWLKKVGFGRGEMFKTVRNQMFEDRRDSFVEANKIDGSLVQSNEINKNKDMLFTSDVIRCPDGRICKIGDSCCRKETGGFGCCPYLNATCCSDMIHCCPKGYQCDVEDSMCMLVEFEETSVPQSHFEGKVNRPKTLVASKIANAENTRRFPIVSQSSHLCPNDPSYTTCPDNMTCCWSPAELANKCCPFSSGVCCDDGLSCCPNGFQCDTGNKRCLKSAVNNHIGSTYVVSVPSTLISSDPATSVETIVKKERFEGNEIVCPNGQDNCPVDTTCCENNSKGYGCCSYPDAVCCSDRIHCCPNDYSCDLVNQKCMPNYGTIFNLAVPYNTFEVDVSIQSKEDKESSDIVCPNGKDSCREGETCCLADDKSYGCCPVEGAVCCSDGKHCCPNGYTCDLANAECVMNPGNLMRLTIPFISKDNSTQNEKDKESLDIACPNEICPKGQTCCLTDDEMFACCPLAGAVCCFGGDTCCPNGYTCDLTNDNCLPNFKGGEMRVVQPSRVQRKYSVLKMPLDVSRTHADETEDPMIMCPDKIDYCKAEETCCELSGGRYGCCPTKEGVCCADKETCCPHGTICENGGCAKGSQSNFITDFLAMNFKGGEMRVVQPSRVQRKYSVLKMPLDVSRTHADETEDPMIMCPDKIDYCKAEETCCELSGGRYGCCPTKEGVCCADKETCCPHGTICENGGCARGSQSNFITDFLAMNFKGGEMRVVQPSRVQRKYSVLKMPLDVSRTHADETEDPMIMCPNKIDYCKAEETCCELSGGRYGCCPTKEGVCCADKETCCPHGTICDNGGCARGSQSNVITDFLAMNFKGGEMRVVQPSRVQKKYSVLKTFNNLIACLDGTNCADKSTCCKTKSGNYGCCPYENGSCCPDGIHCCPTGTKCDDIHKRCIHSFLSNFVSKKESASLMYNNIVEKFEVPLDVSRTHADETKHSGIIICPDVIDICSEEETCCELSGGSYGCCPTKQGVCCANKETCCPHGTICDNGGCTRGSHSNVITDFLAIVRAPYH